jgi:hypothetical protein
MQRLCAPTATICSRMRTRSKVAALTMAWQAAAEAAASAYANAARPQHAHTMRLFVLMCRGSLLLLLHVLMLTKLGPSPAMSPKHSSACLLKCPAKRFASSTYADYHRNTAATAAEVLKRTQQRPSTAQHAVSDCPTTALPTDSVFLTAR